MNESNQLHIPVLLKDVLEHIPEPDINKFSLGLDGTFGRGGHSLEILKKFEKYNLVGMDRDLAAIEFGRNHFGDYLESQRLMLLHSNYIDLQKHLSAVEQKFQSNRFRFILLDLGVSSPQLDDPERGFSFYHDGPLDMRMNQEDDLKASDIVNEWSEEDLIEVFRDLGEVSRPGRVVRAI